MALEGFKLKIKPMEIISKEEIETIHKATINILKETGMKFENRWALDLLKKNDCNIDNDKMIAKFPEELVQKCLDESPESFRFKARDKKNDVILGSNTVYFHSAPGMNTIDIDTFEPRPPSKSEYVNYIKILDVLPNLHKISAYPYWGYKGVSPVMAIPESVALKIIYSSKTQEVAYSNDCEIFTIKMAKAAGIEFMSGLHATSPLGVDNASIVNARRIIKAGFPISIANGCTMGGTSPATTAGSLVVSNAELLAMITFVQLVKFKTRIQVWDCIWPMNMKSGSPYFGQIQDSIENVLFNQIWREKYKIPIGNATTGYPGSKNIGYQSGYEKGIACLMSALSGANVIQFHGTVFGELSAHSLQAILDDDIAGIIGKIVEGVTVNKETIALDLIKDIGTIPGNYLNTDHTRKWWKQEQYIAKAVDNLTYDEWIESGKRNEIDYAKDVAKKIVNNYNSKLVEEKKIVEIQNILEEARNYYKVKGLL